MEHFTEQNGIWWIHYRAPQPPRPPLSFPEVPCLCSLGLPYVLNSLPLPPSPMVVVTVSPSSRTSAVLALPLTLPWSWRVDWDCLTHTQRQLLPMLLAYWDASFQKREIKTSCKGSSEELLGCFLLLFWRWWAKICWEPVCSERGSSWIPAVEQGCQVWREIAQKGGNESLEASMTNITYTTEPQARLEHLCMGAWCHQIAGNIISYLQSTSVTPWLSDKAQTSYENVTGPLYSDPIWALQGLCLA